MSNKAILIIDKTLVILSGYLIFVYIAHSGFTGAEKILFVLWSLVTLPWIIFRLRRSYVERRDLFKEFEDKLKSDA